MFVLYSHITQQDLTKTLSYALRIDIGLYALSNQSAEIMYKMFMLISANFFGCCFTRNPSGSRRYTSGTFPCLFP